MASELKVNKITPESGLTLTLGDSGDTINFGSGVLPNFENLTVTGDLTVDTNSLKVDSTNNFVGIGTASPTVALDVVGAITATGNITGTLATAAQPNITSLGTLTGLTTTGDINFGDNDKAVFGAGSDLQIYHNSANGKSYIEESGTGNLVIRGTDIDILSGDGEAMVTAIANGAVSLYYDASTYATPKLATTSTGIDVTGTANADIVNIYNASAQGRLNVSNNGAEQLEVFPGDVANKVTLQAFNRSTSTSNSFRYFGLTHEFTTNGSERMRIDSSGNLLVGTTNTTGIPTGNSVNQGAYISPTGIYVNQINNESNIYLSKASGYTYGGFVRFFVTGIERGSITTNGSSVSYNTSSDYRLKENVIDLTSATDRLKQLQPKRFNFIADINTTVDGFLAHEVSSIVPEAIKGTHNEVDGKGNPVYQGIDQSKLVPLLVASLKEALTEIDNLKARVNTLEGN